jgi:hypothetical protein
MNDSNYSRVTSSTYSKKRLAFDNLQSFSGLTAIFMRNSN